MEAVPKKLFHVCIKDFTVPEGGNSKKCVTTEDLHELLPGQVYKPFEPENEDSFSNRRDYGRIKEFDGTQYMCKCMILVMKGKHACQVH